MTLLTLARFLVGDRGAIQSIVATRGAWALGLMFVLSAGFAREYDGEDLLHEPWHLALPLVASLATSLLLYGLIVLVAWRRSGLGWPVASGYLPFVALYWLTAPLAWLYAIPYERFLSPADAVRANLATLGLVSLWRVALMTRVVSVVFRCHILEAMMVVMLFADAVALTLLSIVPLPIFSIMGGIRLTESEQVLLQVACNVRIAAILSLPVWAIGTLSLFVFPRRPGGPWTPIEEFATQRATVARSAWIFAVALLAVGIGLLPLTQRQQQLRRQVETALKRGDVKIGIEVMSAHERDDFPPHWDPPPRIGFGETSPTLVDVLQVIAASEAPKWVEQIFAEKVIDQFAGHYFHPYMFGADESVFPNPAVMDEAQLERYYQLLLRLPSGPRIARAQRERIEHALEANLPEHPLTEQRKDWLEQLLALAEPDESSR
jgi:hypothetical protein